MPDTRPHELSDERLRALAEAASSHDPRGMFKAQQARERDAVLSDIHPRPTEPADQLAAAKEKIAYIEGKLDEAKKAARIARPSEEEKHRQLIGNLDAELGFARRRLADFVRGDSMVRKLTFFANLMASSSVWIFKNSCKGVMVASPSLGWPTSSRRGRVEISLHSENYASPFLLNPFAPNHASMASPCAESNDESRVGAEGLSGAV